jgi:hypothetical protein
VAESPTSFRGQSQPFAHELLNIDWQAEEGTHDRSQSLTIARLGGKATGEEQLGPIREFVAVANRWHPQTEQGSDVGREAVFCRPVKTNRGLRVGPNAIEERENSMVKKV